jgi:hypothetical protein
MFLILATLVFSEYNRKNWKHWTKDCRNKVLQEEIINDSFWVCVFTGDTVYNKSELDIDHLVPLKEAYESGASKWSMKKKEAFANYLSNPNHLVAVKASANRSKGAKDPSKWMPDINKDWYVKEWIKVKTEWDLKYDKSEKQYIHTYITHSEKPRSYFIKGE